MHHRLRVPRDQQQDTHYTRDDTGLFLRSASHRRSLEPSVEPEPR